MIRQVSFLGARACSIVGPNIDLDVVVRAEEPCAVEWIVISPDRTPLGITAEEFARAVAQRWGEHARILPADHPYSLFEADVHPPGEHPYLVMLDAGGRSASTDGIWVQAATAGWTTPPRANPPTSRRPLERHRPLRPGSDTSPATKTRTTVSLARRPVSITNPRHSRDGGLSSNHVVELNRPGSPGGC